MRKSLDEMARSYGTDKGGQWHGYAEAYERLLFPLKASEGGMRLVVEVGVCRKWDGNRHICPSLAMWLEWGGQGGGAGAMGPMAVGLDKCEFAVNSGSMRTLVCDQGRLEDLNRAKGLILEEYGQADLIVDDGSHVAEHQQMTMRALWPMLRGGGAYVIEDLNYNPEGAKKAERRRTRECIEDCEGGEEAKWLVDLGKVFEGVDRVEWVDSAKAGARSAVVVWKRRGL